MDWQQYYLKILKATFLSPWVWCSGIATALSLVLPLIVHFEPNWELWMNPLLWQIPLLFLISASIVRFVCAPYWVYREVEDKFSKETATLKGRIGALEESAPEIMLDFPYTKGSPLVTPLYVNNIGGGNARNVHIDFDEGEYVPIYDEIPYLKDGEKVAAHMKWTTRKDADVAVYMGQLVSVLQRDSGISFEVPITVRVATVSYENKHGIRFAQDFKFRYNPITEKTTVNLHGVRRRLTPHSFS